MAWKPWYERMAEIESAEERYEFTKGVFGFAPTRKRDTTSALVALMAGFGIGYLSGGRKK